MSPIIKLKDFMHCSKLWVIILFTIQALYISAFLFYYVNTKYCCEITIYTSQNSDIEFVTPIGNTYTEHIDANCKTIIPKRPLKQIKVDSNISLSYSTNKVYIADVFVFLRGRGFLLTWIFLSLLCITAILINKKEIFASKVINPLKQKWHITKRRFHKYLLRGKTNDAKSFKIDKKSYIILIVLAVFWVILAFIPYSHKQIGQAESGKYRALVALEMKLSGNYIAPTLNGVQYTRKPPLFNYLLLPALRSQQNAADWMQFISALTAFILVGCMYLVSRQLLNKHKSLFATIIFAYSPTCFINIVSIGLDSLFATFCILIFISNLYFAQKGRYLTMFLVGYLLTALAFMTKGTPAIYFQGISLLSIIIVQKESYKQIFSWKHAIGTLPFIAIIGTYCVLYSKYYNPLSYFAGIFSDIPEKIETGNYRRLTNILSFFGKSIVAYPILSIFPILLRKNTFVQIIRNQTDSYLMLISLFGIVPFFIGDYYVKYILMFVPLITILIIKHLTTNEHISASKILLLWGIPIIFITIASLVGRGNLFDGSVPIYSLALILPFVLLLHNCKLHHTAIICIYTIVTSIFVLHIKYPTDTESPYANLEKKANQIAEETSCGRIYILPDSKINYATMFYLTYYKGEIITIAKDSVNKGDFYLTNLKYGTPLDSIPQLHEPGNDPYGEAQSDSYSYLYKK